MFGSNDNGARILGAFLGVVFVAVLVGIFMYYVLLIALGIIVLIAFVLGTIHTLKNFILSFAEKNRSYSGSGEGFIKKMFSIFGETFMDGISRNFENAKEYFSQSSVHRILSFKKWLYIFTAVAILIFGTITAIGIMIIPCIILLMLTMFILIALILIFIVSSIIGIIRSLYETSKIYVRNNVRAYENSSAGFIEYYKKMAFFSFIDISKDSFEENFVIFKDLIDESRNHSLISVKKWYFISSGIAYLLVSNVLLILYIIINIVVTAILCLICLLLGLFIK